MTLRPAPASLPPPTVRILSGLKWAQRCEPRPTPRSRNPRAMAGRAFERKVITALRVMARGAHLDLEPQPWFAFRDAFGPGRAAPDALLHGDGWSLVIEVKLTFTLAADAKLRGLYLPLAAALTGHDLFPLIICKHLTPDAQLMLPRVRAALTSPTSLPVPTYSWLGVGPIEW